MLQRTLSCTRTRYTTITFMHTNSVVYNHHNHHHHHHRRYYHNRIIHLDNNKNDNDDMFDDEYVMDPSILAPPETINNVGDGGDGDAIASSSSKYIGTSDDPRHEFAADYDGIDPDDFVKRLRDSKALRLPARQLMHLADFDEEVDKNYITSVVEDRQKRKEKKAVKDGYLSDGDDEEDAMMFKSGWFKDPPPEDQDLRLSELPELPDLDNDKGKASTGPLRERSVDHLGRSYGYGGRKSAHAKVWIKVGTGKITVNGKPHTKYFDAYEHLANLYRPFQVTDTVMQFDMHCVVSGGGPLGKSGAIRLAVSRALQQWDPSLRWMLKRDGYMTRDHRRVERKKPGQKKARKKFQWVKR